MTREWYSVFIVLGGRKIFNLLNKLTDVDNFELIVLIWESKVKCLSMRTPKNFILSVSSMKPESILLGSRDYFLRYEKLINLHLLILILSLFTLIQCKTYLRVVLRRFEIWSGDVFSNLKFKVLSSSNSVKLKTFEHLGKSLINMRNSNGPRMDPWGTPFSIWWWLAFMAFMYTYCPRCVTLIVEKPCSCKSSRALFLLKTLLVIHTKKWTNLVRKKNFQK